MKVDSVPILAVLFDRDDVLLEMDREGIGRALLSKLQLPPQEMNQRWEAWTRNTPPIDAEAEQGAIRAFLRALSEEMTDPGVRDALLAFDYTHFVRTFPEAPAALAAAHARGLRVGVLSNNTVLMSPQGLLSITGLSELVDVALTAQMIGASKPAPKAYQLAAEALGVAPEACLFFDNNAAWVEAARALGIRAYHVDRSREEHDLRAGVVRDLSALPAILEFEEQ